MKTRQIRLTKPELISVQQVLVTLVETEVMCNTHIGDIEQMVVDTIYSVNPEAELTVTGSVSYYTSEDYLIFTVYLKINDSALSPLSWEMNTTGRIYSTIFEPMAFINSLAECLTLSVKSTEPCIELPKGEINAFDFEEKDDCDWKHVCIVSYNNNIVKVLKNRDDAFQFISREIGKSIEKPYDFYTHYVFQFGEYQLYCN